MASYLRRSAVAVGVKIETTTGTDAWSGGVPVAGTDYVKADVDLSFDQSQIANPEKTGTIDVAPAIPGGTKVKVTLTCVLRGSGTPATAPQWGKLMQLCSYSSAAISPITATAATAGTANTATCAAGFSTVSQFFRGYPAILTGNPTGPVTTFVTDYTAAKVATFATIFSPILSTSTLVAIPAGTIFAPTSDTSVMKSGTIGLMIDGLMWKITGAVGTWDLDLTTGGIGMLKFTLSGQYNAPTSQATPAGIVFDSLQPPVFRGGVARLAGNAVRISKASFSAGCTIIEPENPEAAEGFDPPVITTRADTGSLDPLMNVTDTIARAAAFKSGTAQTIAMGLGTAAGNSFGVVVPSAQYTGFGPTNRNELMAENLPFAANGQDSGLFLVQY
jgi:hypothetical protein